MMGLAFGQSACDQASTEGPLTGPQSKPDGLFQNVENGKHGYIDKSGKWRFLLNSMMPALFLKGWQRYGQLSRFGPRIKEGKHIEQKQIIAYSGSTGFSTGPHLDFRLSKNGKFIDPLKQAFPAGKPIRKNDKEAFQKTKDENAYLRER